MSPGVTKRRGRRGSATAKWHLNGQDDSCNSGAEQAAAFPPHPRHMLQYQPLQALQLGLPPLQTLPQAPPPPLGPPLDFSNGASNGTASFAPQDSRLAWHLQQILQQQQQAAQQAAAGRSFGVAPTTQPYWS